MTDRRRLAAVRRAELEARAALEARDPDAFALVRAAEERRRFTVIRPPTIAHDRRNRLSGTTGADDG